MDHARPSSEQQQTRHAAPSRQAIAMDRLAKALGYRPEIMADEWLEAIADACCDPRVAKAVDAAYRKRDAIGWSHR